LKFTAQVGEAAPAGKCSTSSAGFCRSNSRSSALLPVVVTVSGEASVMLSGTVTLPALPCAPAITIWLQGTVVPAGSSNPLSGSPDETSNTSHDVPLLFAPSVSVADV
jgi:hypothetical protein